MDSTEKKKSLPEGRTLKSMRKQLEKREKYDSKKSKLPFKGMDIFVEMIKQQNMIILKQIAEDNLTSYDEKEKFIDKYMRINYQIPEIIESRNEEINQDIYP